MYVRIYVQLADKKNWKHQCNVTLIGRWASTCGHYGLYTPWHRVHQHLEFWRRNAAPFFHERVNQLTPA